MLPDSLLQRLKERKLVQWALAYLAGTWALVEATNLVVEQFHWPEIVGQVVTVVAFFGFFLTLVLAWYHGEKGYQHVRGPELLIIAVVLVVAGTALSRLERVDETAPGAGDGTGLSELARFAAAQGDRPTIAILPLENLSADPENSYFAAGIHEELLRRLSLVRTLAVISRTSVLQYAGSTKALRAIATELGARYVVEGSVQESGGRVRVQAQLIDAIADHHIWAERYDRSLADLFELQSEVAEAIAQALEAVITPAERARIQGRPTQDAVAYDLYLRSTDRNLNVREEWEAAVEELRQATTRDTAFALAHARLAGVYTSGAIIHWLPSYDSALARAELAIRFDPDLPEGHARRGFILGNLGEYEAAQASLQRALSLNPSLGIAWGGLAALGWWYGDYVAGALAGRQGAKLDPGSTLAPMHLATCLMYVGMPREAAAWYRRLVEVDARNIWGLFGLAVTSLINGDPQAADAYTQRMREAGADNQLVLVYAGFIEALREDPAAAAEALGRADPARLRVNTNALPTGEALLGWAEVRTGRAEGRKRLERLRRDRLDQFEAGRAGLQALNDLIVAASALGDADEVLRWFLEATRRSPLSVYLLRDAPWFESIRGRPEFQSWIQDSEASRKAWQKELAALGPWMPDDVLGQPAAVGQVSQGSQ